MHLYSYFVKLKGDWMVVFLGMQEVKPVAIDNSVPVDYVLEDYKTLMVQRWRWTD